MDIFLPSKRRWAGYLAEAKALMYYQQLGDISYVFKMDDIFAPRWTSYFGTHGKDIWWLSK